MNRSLQDNVGHQEEEVSESRGNLVVETEEGILRETAKKLFSVYHLNKGHRTRRLGVGKKKNVFKVRA